MRSVYFALLVLFALTACEEDSFRDEHIPKVTPSNLVYAETINAFAGEAFSSGQPAVETGGVKASFAIAGLAAASHQMSADEFNAFSIADSTGVISIEAGNLLSPDTYSVDVEVTTDYGKALFEDGYAVEVISKPID